jgi:hypothetical protein
LFSLIPTIKVGFNIAEKNFIAREKLVPGAGLEPANLAAHDFESCVFANFTTPATFLFYFKN